LRCLEQGGGETENAVPAVFGGHALSIFRLESWTRGQPYQLAPQQPRERLAPEVIRAFRAGVSMPVIHLPIRIKIN